LIDRVASAPWREGGCLVHARVPEADLPAVRAALRQAALLAAGEGVCLHQHALREGEPLEAAVGRALGFSPRAGAAARRWIEDIGEFLGARRRDIVILEGERPELDVVIRGGRMVERLRAGAQPLALVLLTSEPLPTSGLESYDLGHGHPELEPLFDLDREARWAAYLHQRVAWEAGGSAERARALAAVGIETLPVGAEEGLEARFAEAAEGWSASEAWDLQGWLDPSPEGPRDPPEGRTWVPPDGRPGEPVPSLARRLLHISEDPALRARCRAALICRPLATWALGQCLWAEASIRPALMRALPSSVEPPPEAERRRVMLDARISRSFSDPIDAWDLTSLGELSKHGGAAVAGLPDRIDDRLGRIRNRLAHNDPFGWPELEELERVLEEVAAWSRGRPPQPGARAPRSRARFA
jgi:hypothetical protein